MAVLPTYKQIGLLAPLALIALRIIQGLSAGGEYTTSLVFLAEHAPNNRRGLGNDLGPMGIGVGNAAGTGHQQLAFQLFNDKPNDELGLAIALCPGSCGRINWFDLAAKP